MSAIVIFLLVVWFIAMTAPLWVLICNSKTYKDRMKLLDLMREKNGREFWQLHDSFDLVAYKQHVKDRVLLRDPWCRYDAHIQKMVAHVQRP